MSVPLPHYVRKAGEATGKFPRRNLSCFPMSWTFNGSLTLILHQRSSRGRRSKRIFKGSLGTWIWTQNENKRRSKNCITNWKTKLWLLKSEAWSLLERFNNFLNSSANQGNYEFTTSLVTSIRSTETLFPKLLFATPFWLNL